ncbi:hypothetical protein [Microbulbifer spongiae]|uniref:Uncharacterized protein n=1 Tax=Microbulbifer spongiae TaxID=2944933 RepID=A0ABY9EFV8_9GAMM|nr:hypothetical protein [Microbulbifer sp. MI-G]WKD49656.1 hypothetical protein M8T91_17475 [Microbulbifer sp. MI-G]
MDAAFSETEATKNPTDAEKSFIALYNAPVDAPIVNRNSFGDTQFDWLMGALNPGDSAAEVMREGGSYRGIFL